jgi:hypothetical protein
MPIELSAVNMVNMSGMGRPKKYQKRKCLAIYLDEADYKWLVLQAGRVPVADWCKERLLTNPATSAAGYDAVRVASPSDCERYTGPPGNIQREKKVPICTHGVARGFHCWQCQGTAKIE